MPDIQFTVSDKKFTIPRADLAGDSFIVSSSPRSYPVNWLDSILEVQTTIKELLNKNGRNVLLVDEIVFRLYFADLSLPEDQVFQVHAIEENKTIQTVLEVVDFLNAKSFSKSETLIVVGGGITQDIGAFVGNVFKRGISWQFYPTTLLSQCDSCIGGKTGINYKKAKNQLALFSAPRKVTICSDFLGTLKDREIQSGLGEILKLLVTGGEEMMSLYEESLDLKTGIPQKPFFKSLIWGALMVKKVVIEVDEFEFDLRRSLNYGHTLGHAIEVLSNYSIPHGQAVAIGMVAVNRMSVQGNFLSESEHQKIKKLAMPLFNTEIVEHLVTDGLEDLLKKDKKTQSGKFTFVFIKDPGKTFFYECLQEANTVEGIKKIIHEEME